MLHQGATSVFFDPYVEEDYSKFRSYDHSISNSSKLPGGRPLTRLLDCVEQSEKREKVEEFYREWMNYEVETLENE